MSISLLAPTIGMFREVIRSYGLDSMALFKKAGIDPNTINNPNARLDYSKALTLIKQSVLATNDPGMWLRVEDYWHPSNLGALGYAWLSSSSLRTALGRLKRYLRMITTGLELHYEEDADGFNIKFKFLDKTATAFGRDIAAVMLLTTLCRANYGKDFSPLQVSFRQPEPPSLGGFQERFRCPVNFNQPSTTITLDLAAIDKPLTTSNPELAQLNDEVIVRYLSNFDKGDIKSRVINEILKQLSDGGVTDSSIAEALHMTSRTLQRKLKDSESSFKELLNEVRTDLAEKYLQNSQYTLTEISYMLGFSETSSFSRAYRRWTGQSPSEARTT